jgi:hypothetical protein
MAGVSIFPFFFYLYFCVGVGADCERFSPEFAGNGEQRFVFGGICVAMFVGLILEERRLGKVKGA